MTSLLSIFECDEHYSNQRSLTLLNEVDDALPPENEFGNVEYKLKLIDPTPARVEHLITQMKWRLREGKGKAIYEIGVEDDGGLKGLTLDEISASLKTLNLMADKNGASVTILNERLIKSPDFEDRKAIEVLVKKLHEDEHNVEVRISVLGSADVGKSSLLGVLTQGELDNGRGKARLNLFRHRHEIRSGRTSSINKEILGFSTNGLPLTYSNFATSEEICKNSSKIIILCDSAGDPKYWKTTLASLTSTHPDYLFLVVNAATGIDLTSLSHLSLAIALDLPIAIIFNKADLCSKYQYTIQHVEQILASSFGKKSLLIENEEDIHRHFRGKRRNDLVPLFLASCVTGLGLDLLYKFTYFVPSPARGNESDKLMKENALFQIDEIFHIQDVGIVVSGFMRSGLIQEGDHLKIGPLEHGEFVEVLVSSLERHRVSRRIVKPSESSTLALNRIKGSDVELDKLIRKGMVLLNSGESRQSSISVCLYFKCRVLIITASKLVCARQATVYIENVRQSVIVKRVISESQGLRQTMSIGLKFVRRPEFILPNFQILLQQGTTKCIGHITKVFPLKPK